MTAVAVGCPEEVSGAAASTAGSAAEFDDPEEADSGEADSSNSPITVPMVANSPGGRAIFLRIPETGAGRL